MRTILLICVTLLFTACQANEKRSETMTNPTVTVKTSMGDIQVELLEKEAPFSVKNFLQYADEKFYNGTIFHRVIDGFMVQGGGLTAEMDEKKNHDPIRNEADNRLPNKRGTIAMARTSDIHSATSQFFINVSDNDGLNYRNPTPNGFGYCVFGKVISGMDVVEKIKKCPTTTKKGHDNVPVESITILEVVRN
ncbi:MAG: Peptidyl-prolyl cis-trans isomerase A [Chlamydiae bacterium]|nr:Peptidyl-prolyl cis-trans isomerase A [Chlamydiota bacterium]